MPENQEIVSLLNEWLRPEDFQDATFNGLQIEGGRSVSKIAFAVDSSLEVFQKAADWNAGMLIVHHGLIWNRWKKITGFERKRLKVLLDHEINLYVSHLPLDANPEIGHNTLIANLLGGKVTGRMFDGIGAVAEFNPAISVQELLNRVRKNIHQEAQYLVPHQQPVSHAVISSGAVNLSMLNELIDSPYDTLISGEPSGHAMFHGPVLENNIRAVFAGHYHTEKFGILKLKDKLEDKFRKELETLFIDCSSDWNL